MFKRNLKNRIILTMKNEVWRIKISNYLTQIENSISQIEFGNQNNLTKNYELLNYLYFLLYFFVLYYLNLKKSCKGNNKKININLKNFQELNDKIMKNYLILVNLLNNKRMTLANFNINNFRENLIQENSCATDINNFNYVDFSENDINISIRQNNNWNINKFILIFLIIIQYNNDKIENLKKMKKNKNCNVILANIWLIILSLILFFILFYFLSK